MKFKFSFAISLLVFWAGFSVAQFSFAQTGVGVWPDGNCHYLDRSIEPPNAFGSCDPSRDPLPPPTPTPTPPASNTTPVTNTTTTPTTTPAQSTGGPLPNCDYNNPNGVCLPPNPVCTSGNSNSIACSGNVNLVALIAKVIDYLLYFAGIIAVVFVIIGGYTYMTARGAEAQAKSGLATVKNALIGLIITILAYTIVAIITSFLTK